MTYNPEFHHRQSIRLKDYDYSQQGVYFVTVCAKDRLPLFGTIRDGDMHLNQAGQMITRWWDELPNKFQKMKADKFVVMPNHLHGIIQITGAADNDHGCIVGADRCVCPDDKGNTKTGQPHRVAPTLGNIINWFKTMTTNDYIHGINEHGWDRFSGKLWQRNYYEHIIRDERELHAIREYIRYNPMKWNEDEENPNMKRVI